MEEILISIIVPVYNIMEYIPRCVQSICDQTYARLEIILVDDGSTDGTGELCDKLAHMDNRIQVIHKQNGGSSSARNMGIRRSKGTYIGFVDSDDFVAPHMYEHLLKGIRETDAKIAQVGRDEIDQEGNALPMVCMPPTNKELIKTEEFMRELLLQRGDCSFCTKLVARELFLDENGREHLFPEGVLNEDFCLLVSMLPELKQIVSLPDVDYHVFYRIGSNTRKESKEDFSRVYEDIVDNADMVMGVVDQFFPRLKKEAVRFNLYQRLDYLLHIPVSRMKNSDVRYKNVKKYLRRHILDTISNPYLNKKNKCYLMILTPFPRLVRKLHQIKMNA